MAISGFPIFSPNTVPPSVGDLSQLPTTNKSDIVGAIVELDGDIKNIPVFHQEKIELTALDIANKFIEFDFLPSTDSVELFVIQGINQKQNVDFVVTGQTLSWANLALELLLEVGSFLHISYKRG